MEDNPLRKLESFGQSIWLDFTRRGMVASGEFRRLIEEDGLSGVTSNPSIFEKAIDGSHDYDEAIRDLALAGRSADEIYQALTVEDVRMAADLFRPTFDRTEGRDGFVSLEVSPYLAHDTARTVAEARRLWAALGRPNVMIKVPATRAGLPAIERLTAEGVNVNVTLLFGLARYREVVDAYLRGLEDRAAQGRPLSRVASVASFFLSRIDVLVDPMLERRVRAGGPEAELAASLRGQAALASAKVAYQIYKEVFSGERFRALAGRGAHPQRPLWASTSTKDPAYSDVKYVEALIGPETINTLPLETLDNYREHGRPAPRLEEGIAEAYRVLERLPMVGVNLDTVTQQLEDEGVAKFGESLDTLVAKLREKVAVQPEQTGAHSSCHPG
jgi:transaldolase